MTATQAPTPGPLSGEVDDLAKKLFQERWPGKSWHGCDVSRSYWRRKAKESLGLGSSAPVEASGSERGWSDAEIEAAAQALVNHRWNGTQPGFDCKPPSWKAEHVAEVRAVLAALRPQPSGEAREAVARIIKELVSGPHFTDPALYEAMDQDRLIAADRILALLSARPLALGGQS